LNTNLASKYKFLYSYKGLQIKGYVKDKAIRFEITLNSKYMNEMLNGERRVDRKDIFQVNYKIKTITEYETLILTN